MNRTVVVLVNDPFWRTKIEHAAKSAQSQTLFLSDPKELSTIDPGSVGVVFVDLALQPEPYAAITKLKKGAKSKGMAVIGYYDNARKDVLEKGKAAGCDRVLPRPTFSEKLADLVLEFSMPGSVRTEEVETELPEE